MSLPTYPPNQEEKALRLRRMKRIPLLLLFLMVLLFALTLNRPEAWAGWLHAFAEAGMVGMLSGIFLVTVLTRMMRRRIGLLEDEMTMDH